VSGGLAVWAILLAVVSGCGQAPTPTGPTGQPIDVEGRDAGFALSMRVDSDVVDAGAAIDVSAILTWEGAAPAATIWGSAGGPVSFGIEQLDGKIVLIPINDAACATHDYAHLVPVAIPFQKSGGFTENDPNAAFYRTYFADPVLRLPAGHWKVSASASGYVAPCDMNAPEVAINLEAEILVR
jgi:hypothetical protein